VPKEGYERRVLLQILVLTYTFELIMFNMCVVLTMIEIAISTLTIIEIQIVPINN
jgi:hypothetical protein